MTGRPASPAEAGLRALMRGDRAEAERLWRAALADDPGNERIREYLASVAGEGAPAPAAGATPAPHVASAWDEVPAHGTTLELPPDGGVDLSALAADALPIAPVPAPPVAHPDEELAGLLRGARELFALGDFSGSLELVERVLHVEPGHAEALAYLRENEATLVAMYESRLGALDAVPRIRVSREDVLWLNLDHRAGFLLAQIDGSLTWDDLFALSGMPRLDTARILARLVEDGVVAAA